MGVGCCVRVLRARSQRPGQSRRVRREGCRGSTGWGLYKGPIPIVTRIEDESPNRQLRTYILVLLAVTALSVPRLTVCALLRQLHTVFGIQFHSQD
jgi:hypothetical protein